MSSLDKRNGILSVSTSVGCDDLETLSNLVGKLVLVCSVKNSEGESKIGLLIDSSKNDSYKISDFERDKFEKKVAYSNYLRDRALSIATEVMYSAASLGIPMKDFSNSVFEFDSLRSEIIAESEKNKYGN